MKNWYNTAFWTLLSLNLIFGLPFTYVLAKKGGFSYLAAKLSMQADGRQNANYSNYYLTRVSLFNHLEGSDSDIYLMGDSITDIGEWQELFSNPDVKNRGISGDTTAGVLNRLDEVVAGKPRKIFLMIGINNIQKQISYEQTVNDYEKIIAGLREGSPETRIYVQSVLPVNKKIYGREIIPKFVFIHMPTDLEIQRINEYLKKLSGQYEDVEFVDLSELTDKSGDLAAEYTFDGLHLNGRGLVAWSNVIRPLLIR